MNPDSRLADFMITEAQLLVEMEWELDRYRMNWDNYYGRLQEFDAIEERLVSAGLIGPEVSGAVRRLVNPVLERFEEEYSYRQ